VSVGVDVKVGVLEGVAVIVGVGVFVNVLVGVGVGGFGPVPPAKINGRYT